MVHKKILTVFLVVAFFSIDILSQEIHPISKSEGQEYLNTSSVVEYENENCYLVIPSGFSDLRINEEAISLKHGENSIIRLSQKNM